MTNTQQFVQLVNMAVEADMRAIKRMLRAKKAEMKKKAALLPPTKLDFEALHDKTKRKDYSPA